MKEKHKCPDCGRYYKSEHRLKNHITRKHKKRQSFGEENPCCYCGNSFPNRSELGKHVKQEHGEDYYKLNKGNCYIKRYKQVKSEVPTAYTDAFDELTGQGRSLLSVQAAICYIESTATQEIAAEAFAVSENTVRRLTRELIDMGVVDAKDITKHKTDWAIGFNEQREGAETLSWECKS